MTIGKFFLPVILFFSINTLAQNSIGTANHEKDSLFVRRYLSKGLLNSDTKFSYQTSLNIFQPYKIKDLETKTSGGRRPHLNLKRDQFNKDQWVRGWGCHSRDVMPNYGGFVNDPLPIAFRQYRIPFNTWARQYDYLYAK